MTQWLIDTFVWTGALIALVLVLRRPVARHFGPQVAYALWALPLVRLVLPPLVLPASMAPAGAATAPVMAPEPLLVVAMNGAAAASEAPAAAAAPLFSLPWNTVLLALWLGGAAVFLCWRLHQYRLMRRDLLADARPVGQAGAVRLVETPAVSSPVAFGIADKVVALPPLFMAQRDIAARDLAIAHELAHHRGHDLAANMAAQLLLALHWFNPLAWWGWRAMRKDQEAACDARVVAGREREEKAAYARVIAGFATGRHHLALAAPMACPVLGEKSIIHRLRSLTMAEHSASRRRMGLAAIAGSALVALPLTASITYAQGDGPAAPLPPAAPQAPLAPEAPVPPAAVTGEHGEPVQRRIIIRRGPAGEEAADAAMAADMARMEADLARMESELADLELRCDGEQVVRQQQDADGRRVMIVCRRAAQDQAALGLREAQRAIREAEGLPEEQRRRITDELQREIDRLEAEQVSFLAAPLAPKVPASPQAPAAIPVPAAPVAPAMVVQVKLHLPDGSADVPLVMPVRLVRWTVVPKVRTQQS